MDCVDEDVSVQAMGQNTKSAIINGNDKKIYLWMKNETRADEEE